MAVSGIGFPSFRSGSTAGKQKQHFGVGGPSTMDPKVSWNRTARLQGRIVCSSGIKEAARPPSHKKHQKGDPQRRPQKTKCMTLPQRYAPKAPRQTENYGKAKNG